MENRNRQVLLKRRPNGAPTTADFEIADGPVPDPGDGEALVRGIYLSLDPYMGGRSAARPLSYRPLRGRSALSPVSSPSALAHESPVLPAAPTNAAMSRASLASTAASTIARQIWGPHSTAPVRTTSTFTGRMWA